MSAAVRKAFASLALLVFLGSLGLASVPSRHLLVGLDADCASPFLTAQSGRQIDAAPEGQAAPRNHCVLCHWLRAIGGAAPSLATIATPAFLTAGRLHLGERQLPREQVGTNASSRAPPSLHSLTTVQS
jgi:hypothetical protein